MNDPSQFALSEATNLYSDSLTVSLGFSGDAPTFLAGEIAISGHLVSLP